MKEYWKKIKRIVKRVTRKEIMFKVLVIVSGLALVATSVLPYILR